MAWSINKAFILGNITRDPELRYTPNGQSVTSFGIATNRRWKDAAGAIQEDTQFHDIVAWGKLAETISQFAKKGDKMAAIGRLQTRNWEGPDGSKRSRTEIIMEDFVPLAPRDRTGGTTVDNPPVDNDSDIKPTKPSAPSEKTEKPAKKAETNDEEINLDDIPF